MQYDTVWNGRKDNPKRGMLFPPSDENGEVLRSRTAPRHTVVHEVKHPKSSPGASAGDILVDGPTPGKVNSRMEAVKLYVRGMGNQPCTREHVVGWLMETEYLDRPGARAAVHYAIKAQYIRVKEFNSALHQADVSSEDEGEEYD